MTRKKRNSALILISIIVSALFIMLNQINAEATSKNQLTAKMVSDYFKSETHLTELSKMLDKNISIFNSVEPRSITIYTPFQIPFYSAGNNTTTVNNTFAWYCPVAVDNKISALLHFSYGNELVLSAISYLPTELATKIYNNEDYSLFLIEAETTNQSQYEDNGALMYAINKSGKNIFTERELYTNIEYINVYSLKTDTSVYKKVSKYNSLSNSMEAAITLNLNTTSAGFSDGAVISFRNLGADRHYWKFNGSSQFIIHYVGNDDNNEAIYSLSPKNKPNSKIKIAGSTDIHIRCEVGGTVPIYSIRSAKDTKKVITYTDDGVKCKKWEYSENQEWLLK